MGGNTYQNHYKKEVKSYSTLSAFPTTGSADKIYIDEATNTPYYWNGTAYVPLSSPAADTVSVYVQSSSTTKPSPGVEGDELIVTDTGLASGTILEQWIYDSTTSTWIQRPNDKVLDVLTTTQTPPTIGSIATTNLGKIYTGTDGNSYITDYSGESIQLGKADIAYKRALFVDPINGSDTTGTGSDNAMFQTITKALTVANNTGYRIVLAPGTYNENPTISLPNLDIVTLAGSDRGNTSIQGTVTFSHISSSSGIQGISMTNLRHSGAGALYVTDCQVNSTFEKTSTGYIEITDSQLQGTTAVALSAGTGLIKDSLIKNMTISGASSGYTLKSNIIDADGTVTFSGGAFYNIQDNSGNIVTTAGVNMETGLIASGLSAALAKQYVTDFSNKLGMLNPDTNNANVNVVSWNTTTRRLEVSALPIGGAIWYSGTNVPTATGNTATSLGVATLPANYFNTTTGDQFYIDANGVSRLIQKGFLTTSLTAQYGNGTTHVAARANSATTVADVMRLSDGSLVNNEDIVTWVSHGLQLHAWYFLSDITAGGYTPTPPTNPSFVQRLFYVVDANTVKIAVQEASVQSVAQPSIASAMGPRGTIVQLDNVRVQIPTTGNASIQVATVSGTGAFHGQNEIIAGTGLTVTATAPLNATTTFAYVNAATNFGGSGNQQRYTFIDATTNRTYRVTMVVGPTFASNAITIERIA
jgi:hypothetical protein